MMDAEVEEVLEELAEECTRSGDRAQARAEETTDQYDELRASGRAEGWHGAAVASASVSTRTPTSER